MKQLNHNHTPLISLLIFTCSLVVLFFYCAYKVAPSGGPEDKTPPEIISHFPQTDSVGIKQLHFIEIEFSETIRRTTLPNNFWMLPELENNLEVEWKGGRKVRFVLQDSLEKNQTYVFTLGTGITDMHSNILSSPFQIAFSTGKKLDNGSISGQVFADQLQRDVYIYAYLVQDSTDLDSLIYSKPRYYSQIDKMGKFRLNYLSLNTYRMIALSDEDYNEIYTIETDQIGLPFTDVTLDSLNPEFSDLNFYLIREDTTSPRIVDLDTLPNREVIVEFNEGITLESEFTVQVIDSISREKIPLLGISFSDEQPTFISLFLPEMPSRQKLEVLLSGIRDLSGNVPGQDTLKKTFLSPADIDTTSPEFQGTEPKRMASKIPFDSMIKTNSSVPIDSESFKKCFLLEDSSGYSVTGSYNFRDLRKPQFLPDSPLQSNMTYQIQLQLDSLKDLWKRSFADTILIIQFFTLDLADLGEISGGVSANFSDWKQGLVQAREIRGRTIYRVTTSEDKTFQLNYIPEGFYLLTGILDLNQNAEWDKGQTDPWILSEPFLFKADTVKVRKRWTTQGINFNFK
jgi:hypothetical protein